MNEDAGNVNVWNSKLPPVSQSIYEFRSSSRMRSVSSIESAPTIAKLSFMEYGVCVPPQSDTVKKAQPPPAFLNHWENNRLSIVLTITEIVPGSSIDTNHEHVEFRCRIVRPSYRFATSITGTMIARCLSRPRIYKLRCTEYRGEG